MEFRNVAVVGAGEMGHGIALVFAIGGYQVSLMDKYPEMLEKAKGRIVSSLAKSVARGRLDREQAEAAISRIKYTGELADAVASADLVIEAVPESPELKKSVLKEVCEHAPKGAVIATNTSNIRISELGGATSRPESVIGMHFFNPPVSMKLVEVIPGSGTDPAVADEVSKVSDSIGKTPVRVLRDSPGFIVDRINAADTLFFCLVLDRGVATPAEVDNFARRQGLPMGPYELLDFAGIDVAQDMLTYFSRALSPEYGKAEALRRMVDAGQLGKKSGRGFYDWSTGRAVIPVTSPTDKVSLMDLFSIEINEAVKLIEEGVARPDDIEKGVTLGMNRPFGPISVARDLSNSEVKTKLEELASKYDCKIFSPTKSIAEGRMKETVEGRTGAAEAQGQAEPAPPAKEETRPEPAPPAKEEAMPVPVPEAKEEPVPPAKEEIVPEPKVETMPEPAPPGKEETVPEVKEETVPEVKEETVPEAKAAPPPASVQAEPPSAQAASEPVRLERLPGGVARLVLNRPRLNTINAAVLDAIDQAVTELWDDHEVRVVVVTGEGGHFSAGADLSQFFSSSVSFTEFTRKGGRILSRLSELPKLTVAVIKGHTLGGGLELALSCDLRLSTEDADLGFPEVSRGLVPAWTGTQRLPRLIGLSRASAMILTSERITGKAAHEIGLVNRLIPPGDPDEFAVKYATELAATQAPVAVMLAKRLLNKGSEVPSDAGLEMEAMASGILFGTDDLKEGVSAFLGKRKPDYKGK